MKLGNCVGTAPFKNTNRKNVKYTKRLNRKARMHGFPTHAAFVRHLLAVMPGLTKVES